MSPYTDVYLDVVFLINFTMDFFILWAAAKLGRLSTNFKRLVLGAAMGSIYALMFFFPALSFTGTFLAKLICSLLMIIISFRPNSIRRFFKSAAYFYLVSFVMGGAVLGSMYLFEDSPLYIETWNGVVVNSVNFKTTWLLIGLAIAIILGFWGASFIRRNLQQGPWLVKVKVFFPQKVIEMDALVDTGNQLIDPISKEPVMIIEHKKMKEVLPDSLFQMLNNKDMPPIDQQIDTLTGKEWATRLRLIPFASLGNQNGMLIGLKPNEIVIYDNEKVFRNSKVIAAIYNKRLCSQGSYQGLVHPDMLTND